MNSIHFNSKYHEGLPSLLARLLPAAPLNPPHFEKQKLGEAFSPSPREASCKGKFRF